MQESIQSMTIATQTSSGKSYFVKRKGIRNESSKDAKQFFKLPEYKEQCIQTLNRNHSGNLKTLEDSMISSKHQINQNRFVTISPGIAAKSTSDIFSLVQSNEQNTTSDKKSFLAERLNSVSCFLDSVGSKRVYKKFVFETIVDQSFNKSLTKKQIVINDPDLSNPQTFNFLPQISKSNSSTQKNSILESIISKSNFSKNNSQLTENSPFYVLQNEVANKFSIQKLKDYRKLWMVKERKRKQLNQISKIFQKTPSLSLHSSLLQKSDNQSRIITRNNNKDIQLRKSKSYWEQELRGNKKKYTNIGEISTSIQGLKGQGQKSTLSIQDRPNFFSIKRNFECEEVYKCHKSKGKIS